MTPRLPHFPVLETERLTLRAPEAADCTAMLAFLASDRAQFYAGPMPADDGWRKLAVYAGQWLLRGYGMFAITRKSDGETIGMAGPFHPQDFPEPEMSWLLTDARHEGKGYAVEACRAVLDHLYSDLGWSNVVSCIDRANTASRRLAERLGARLDPASVPPIANCQAYRHYPAGPSA